jgi:ribosomal protein S27E
MAKNNITVNYGGCIISTKCIKCGRIVEPPIGILFDPNTNNRYPITKGTCPRCGKVKLKFLGYELNAPKK